MMMHVLLAGQSIPAGALTGRLPGTFVALANYLRLLVIPLHLLILAKLVSRLTGERIGRLVVISITLVVFYSALTIRQNNYWKKLIPFYERTLKYAPESARLYNNLGVAYNNIGRHREAVAAFRKVLELEPKYMEVSYNLGTAYFTMGKYEGAIAHFKKRDSDQSKLLYEKN